MADRVTKTHPDENVSDMDARLAKFFKKANIGKIARPATILDRHGDIIAWYLKGILFETRLVCHMHAISFHKII
jgi:hypothetical protein